MTAQRHLLLLALAVMVFVFPALADPLTGKVTENSASLDAQLNGLGTSTSSGSMPFVGHANTDRLVQLAPMLPAPGQSPRPSASKPLPFSGGKGNSQPVILASSDAWMITVGPPAHPFQHDFPINFHGEPPRFNAPFVSAWNKWTENLLHMIYANLQSLPPPTREIDKSAEAKLFVRQDGMLKLQETGHSGQVQQAIEALSGLPQLSFPTPLPGDTVDVLINIRFGKPDGPPLDVWGRPAAQPAYPWQYRYAW